MRIGIMTMHRVQNVGSVLQAYALQNKIEQFGHDVEIIDYVFPPPKERHFSPKDVISWGWDAMQGFPARRKSKKMARFRNDFLHTSSIEYSTHEELISSPPKCDIYCTGSDQVWNPKHVGYDTSFMLDFAPKNAPRISYASSFATAEIEEPFFSLYAQFLEKYDSLTVREQSGINIINKMTGKNAQVVCDPTLLLTKTEWETVANQTEVGLSKGYILIYLLRYMFDPRPGFYNIVESVRQALNLPVYQFNPYSNDGFHKHIIPLRGMGPMDFVSLVKNASFIVTDSFHGAAFATIYNIPMIGIVKDASDAEGRIATLRKNVGGENSIIQFDQTHSFVFNSSDFYKCDSLKYLSFMQNSTDVLRDMIERIR